MNRISSGSTNTYILVIFRGVGDITLIYEKGGPMV